MCCTFPQDSPSQREQVHDGNEVLYFKVLSEHLPDHEGDLLAEFRQMAHRCPARRKHGGCQCHVTGQCHLGFVSDLCHFLSRPLAAR
jgi:hypothetical protein